MGAAEPPQPERAEEGEEDPRREDPECKGEHALFQRISWRLLPLFMAMVILCYVDRTNLAFAAIQLNEDLHFTPTIFGLGSGIFFLGYATLQIPSNLMLKHTRANVYLATIISAWGVCACMFAFMTSPAQFYGLRLLLGVAEAGAFPGMWYYLSRFYPSEHLTLPYTIVDSGVSVSHVIAGPLAAACLSLDNWGGMSGWQWLFLLEGLPTLVLALVMLLYLPSSPEEAAFLQPSERSFLAWRLRGRGATSTSGGSSTCALLPKAGVGSSSNIISMSDGSSSSSICSDLAAAFTNKYVWYLGAVKFVRDIAGFGIIFWTPTVVNSIINGTTLNVDSHEPGAAPHSAESGVHAALLTAIPFALAATVSFLIAHRSQKMNEKIMHISVPYMVAGSLYALFPWAVARSPILGFICLTMGVVGVYSGSGTNVALLQELTAGPGFVVAAPLFNGIGNIGGFIGPFMVGSLVQRFNTFTLPSLIMATCLVVAGLMVAAMPSLLTLPASIKVGLWEPRAAEARRGKERS